MTNKIHVIAHTHWDYEWYFTNNESFIQLSYHVDEVINALENGLLDYYMLDGQMSIVEDYLKANPDMKTRLNDLVKSGRLKIGPWYTQSDQMIIRGESLVRNLQIGIELGDKLGGADRLGYVPDAFGQSIDMPKIFSQMGINKSVFWRGLSSDVIKQREFLWKSEDGSSVMAYNIKDGYFVGVQLIETNNSKSLLEQIKKDTVASHIALPVGGDQRYVDFNLKERINHYNQILEKDVLIESDYNRLFEGITQERLDLPSIQGEFLNAEVSKIHRSIYSSRYDHNYLNDKVERRLIFQVEPLMALADQIGIPYKQELVDNIWKITLRNHAHDSAGSCNSDKTNQVIMQRLIEADQLSYSLIDYLTRKISESRIDVKENQVTIFNTLPIKRIQNFKVKVSLKDPNFSIYHKGKEIPYQLMHSQEQSNAQIRKKVRSAPGSIYFESEILLPLELNALGYEVLDIVEGEKGIVVSSHRSNIQSEESSSIENEYYEVILNQGAVNVIDKTTGTLYKDFLYIEDDGDDGDNYDYSPPSNNKKVKLDFLGAKIQLLKGKLKDSILISGNFKVPLMALDREQGKQNAEVPYTCEISLEAKNQSIDMNLEIENNACDHRMRLIVNGNVKTDTSIADTPFGTISRPITDPNLHNWKEKGWKEEPTGIYPMLNFVNIHDGQKSITAFSKGVKEYEIVRTEAMATALTLFRAVGYLGKPDLRRRPGVASGNQFRYIETPDSQLQKRLKFKFSFTIKNSFSESDSFIQYQKYAISTPYYQQQSINQFTTTLKYFVMQPLSEPLPNAYSLLDASQIQHVAYSTIKKSRDDKAIIIRLFNPSSETIDDGGKIVCHEKVLGWKFTTLAEKNDIINELQTNTIKLGVFKPKEIKTVYIRLQQR